MAADPTIRASSTRPTIFWVRDSLIIIDLDASCSRWKLQSEHRNVDTYGDGTNQCTRRGVTDRDRHLALEGLGAFVLLDLPDMDSIRPCTEAGTEFVFVALPVIRGQRALGDIEALGIHGEYLGIFAHRLFLHARQIHRRSIAQCRIDQWLAGRIHLSTPLGIECVNL